MGASYHQWRSSKAFVHFVVNLAVFTDAYFYGVIIPVLPFALTEVIKIEQDDVQWWIGVLLAAYGGGLLVGSPIVGFFADRYESRRVPYLLGLIFLTLSTLAISLGRTMPVLIVGRLVQGVSSASVHAVGLAILADKAGNDGMGPAMGLVTTMMSLGAVLGPMFGGFLYHQLGYASVFSSAYILVAADFVARILMVESRKGSIVTDGENYGTFTEANHYEEPVKIFDNGADRYTESGSASPSSLLSNETSKVSEGIQNNKSAYPILLLLAMPRMLAAILCDFIQSLILTGLETVLPLRIKIIFGYNSQDVALVFLVLAIPYAVGPLIGKLADIHGSKAVICIGFSALMPLMILLRLIDRYDISQVALLCVLLFAIGTAMNLVLTPAYSDTMYLVEAKSKEAPGTFGQKGAYAQAFALLNMAYAIGSVVGPLVGGWLVKEVGWNRLTLGSGILCGICVIPCMLYTGGKVMTRGSLQMTQDVDDLTE